MDSSETHYLTYDPEEIYKQMLYAYIENGGDVLYPGDEKEILLRSVQSVIVQAFAGIDNALRMARLRYAVGDYLNLIGEDRFCIRNEAKSASATVEIEFQETGKAGSIAAGTLLTADGERMYAIAEDVIWTGYQQTVQAAVTAQTAGSAGNGLLAGTQMQFLIPQAAVKSVFCVEDASGGQEREDDDSYRERIRTFGLVNTTTGPRVRYEADAMGVTSEILDARALNLGGGQVGIVLLLASESGADAIMKNVEKNLNADSVRPLTDKVIVYRATDIPYTLNVLYKAESGSEIAASIADAVADYQKWQDEIIGRAFNPDRLMAAIYRAGAIRVMWGDGSAFNGGEVAYTEIDSDARCKGTISLGVIT